VVAPTRKIFRCALCSRPWWDITQTHDLIPLCSPVPDWQYLDCLSPRQQAKELARELFYPQDTAAPPARSLRASHGPYSGFIARTKAANRVEDVAQHLTDLRPAGHGKHKGLCPFHPERTASFFVFEDSQRFKCFGCQKHGDVIDLMREAKML
jgi:hypothetical protein